MRILQDGAVVKTHEPHEVADDEWRGFRANSPRWSGDGGDVVDALTVLTRQFGRP